MHLGFVLGGKYSTPTWGIFTQFYLLFWCFISVIFFIFLTNKISFFLAVLQAWNALESFYQKGGLFNRFKHRKIKKLKKKRLKILESRVPHVEILFEQTKSQNVKYKSIMFHLHLVSFWLIFRVRVVLSRAAVVKSDWFLTTKAQVIMMTFDEKPKAVGTSITVTVNSTTMDCSQADDQTTPSNVTPSF